MKKILVFVFSLLFSIGVIGQNKVAKKYRITKVRKPILIMGETSPVKTEALGLAHPTVYDWNNDGKKDLIIGEFDKEAKFRVYINVGSDNKPVFSDNWFYGEKIGGEAIFVKTS